ncbi:hypothetical protein [Frankia tisae]|uniref:hypothetical protein n=1 Tax=Frankia tisae TaxID=2950104 RepID=UPI0021BE421F|nr:hypothetical protein [Frankia tisae]
MAAQALAGTRGEHCRAVEVRARYALGLSAFAATRYLESFEHFTRMFRPDGSPLHWHGSPTGAAALAAARAGRIDEGRHLLHGIEEHLPGLLSGRLRVILGHARALLARADAVEGHYRSAVDDPDTARWPFERALIQLDFGEWLRRQRRIGEARPMLESARATFLELEAQPWQDRAGAELRASGAIVPELAGRPHRWTSQQWEIAKLAAEGLSNPSTAAFAASLPLTTVPGWATSVGFGA